MRIGRIIADKYCLLYELGHGSMGSVWAAEHLTLRSRVAVKLIEPHVYGIPQVPHRFEREARALAVLRSPHVVQVLDYGVNSGNPYLVMELLEGETLRRRLQTYGRLSCGAVWTLALHVSRAMTVAHTAGFVHRDLKPENIFLVNDGDEFVAKVLDFGIAKTLATAATPLTVAGSILGTWQYASPEQVVGQPVDERSDLWSLGVIVFECLTGFLPFNAESAVAALFAICHAPIVVPSQVARVPVGFDAWFARALHRDPAERFQTAEQLAESLRPLLTQVQEWDDEVSCGQWPSAMPRARNDDTLRIDTFPSSMHNRRSNVRIPSSVPVGINGGRDLRNTALIYNVSRTGALLATRGSRQPDETMLLALHLESETHGEEIRASVVRVAPRDDAFWRFEIGVRFAEPLPDELLARIEAKAKT